MKFKFVALTFLLAAFASSALAQTAISGNSKCPKPDTSQNIEVGDQAGHVLVIEKGSCAWSVPFEMAGLKSKAFAFSESVDVTGANSQVRGYALFTMENGDKAFARYQGTGTTSKEGNLKGEGIWTYTGDTGKLKGLKGKGTYKLSGTPDGTSEARLEGAYSLPEAAAAAKK